MPTTKTTIMKKLFVLGLAASLSACNSPAESSNGQQAEETTSTESTTLMTKNTPAWSKQASIYEVNIRQYTPEGTFNAFTEHLDRLEQMGVKILWIMPIQPIGKEKRKGTLGSYYSIADYASTNPEFGTLADFKNLVAEAHKRDMKVILDWVANHTSWDHTWINTHRDWYSQNEQGEVIAPVEDWSDVADLNYDNYEMRNAMEEDMLFWVREADIDGFRCDMAMMVPMDFWDSARTRLETLKPMFMLAEAEGPEFHAKAFDMSYGWELHHIMNDIAKGDKSVNEIDHYLAKQDTLYSKDDYRMFFITNHDENSWNGTVGERMGANGQNFHVLASTLPQSMPLIYSGQEAGLNKRLAFFEKEHIDWTDSSQTEFYTKLTHLKLEHPSLINGSEQGRFERIDTGNDRVYAFKRIKDDAELLVYINLADQNFGTSAPLKGDAQYKDVMNGEAVSNALDIPANSFKLISTTL
jgi:glycosidase